MISERLNLSGF